MSVPPCNSLVSALASLDEPGERTTPAAFAETLADHLRDPAVGVPVDGTAVSLSETDVTVDPTPAQLKSAETGVTPASFAIADYGSVVVPSTPSATSYASSSPTTTLATGR